MGNYSGLVRHKRVCAKQFVMRMVFIQLVAEGLGDRSEAKLILAHKIVTNKNAQGRIIS